MKRLWTYTRADGWRWLLGAVLLLLTNAAAMVVPDLFRRAIDALRQEAPAAHLVRFAWMLVGVAALGALTRTASRIVILYAARDVELKLRDQLYVCMTGLDNAFFEEHPTGDLMSRATNDLTQVRLMLGPGALNLVNTLLAYAVAVPLMARINLPLTLMAFVVYPPAMILMRTLGKRLYLANRRQQEALGQLANVVQENLNSAAMVRAYAIESEQNSRFGQVNDAYRATNMKLAWIRSGMFRLSASLASVGTLGVVWFGGGQVMRGEMSLGEVVALVEYMALLSGPTFAMGWVLSLWQRGLASMARIEQVLDAQNSLVEGSLAVASLPADVQVCDVEVAFDGRRALGPVSLTLPRGQTVAIVGAIGSGKSTLMRALMRLLPLSAGKIFIGDASVDTLDTDSVRACFAYVPQSPMLLNKTLRENIAFGRPDATDEEITAAIEVADFARDLEKMPEGLLTIVGERGVTLSGGQKQRCALARALILHREILLLDDALSAVDTETESRILARLKAHQKGRTTVIVAHRISCVEHADVIYVLNKGAVVAQGVHTQLVLDDGFYADLARRQRRSGTSQTHRNDDLPESQA